MRGFRLGEPLLKAEDSLGTVRSTLDTHLSTGSGFSSFYEDSHSGGRLRRTKGKEAKGAGERTRGGRPPRNGGRASDSTGTGDAGALFSPPSPAIPHLDPNVVKGRKERLNSWELTEVGGGEGETCVPPPRRPSASTTSDLAALGATDDCRPADRHTHVHTRTRAHTYTHDARTLYHCMSP